MGNTMTLLFFFTICINISYFLGHWLYKGQLVYSIINIGFNLWTDLYGVSLCVSMSDLYEVSPCLHVDMDNGVSPCLYVDMDMECLHVSVCLHVFMWIETQSVSMSPCGYEH